MKTAQAKIQKFGSLLSAMVMPNIGVFIGWGLLTALFIDTGWTPNAYLNKLVSPILTYLLPCLIGYTAGSNIYGRRGGVIGAFATMGAVVGADVTMLVAGMILGPVAAICIRAFDKAVEGKVKPGLEMLVDNFSLGIIGFVICIIGYVGVAPIMTAIQTVLTGGVQYLTDHNMLPLTELFVQPAEILFLNNAINHGIMTPLGLQQAAEAGKSVLFLVEASGAAWVGLSLAFAIFGNKSAKKSAPGAVIIMFFGGIAEVCFPYCLTMPLTIIGPILGNMFSLFVLTNFGGGVVGPVSPGSVISYYMMTPKACMLVNTIAYFGSLAISFAGAAIVLKAFKHDEEEEGIKEGDNLKVETKNAAADMGTAGQISDSFVSDKVDLICAIATPSAQSAYNAAMDAGIPVIYTAVTDPVAAELASEDGTPAGEVTGTSDKLPVEEQLKMIREMLPQAKTIGIMYTTSEANSVSAIKEYEDLVGKYDFELVTKGITTTADVSLAADDLLSKVDCITNLTDNTVVASLPTILEKANDKKIPVFGSEIEQVKIGCLAAEGIDYISLGKQTGKMAAQVLKGEKKASELNFETITTPGFYVNNKVAENLGITIPTDLSDNAVEAFDEITQSK